MSVQMYPPMYPVAKGLPNNRILHVLGRAYAAPGEEPPVLVTPRASARVIPVVAAVVALGLAQVLSVWL